MRRSAPVFLIGAALFLSPFSSATAGVSPQLRAALDGFPSSRLETGILYDRVLPMAQVADHDGSPASRPVGWREYRQLYDEMRRATIDPSFLPPLELRGSGESIRLSGLHLRFDRFREDAIASGALIVGEGSVQAGVGDPTDTHRLVAIAATPSYTYRGGSAQFRFSAADFHTNEARALRAVTADLDDGLGPRPLRFDTDVAAHWTTTGEKTLRFELTYEDGAVYRASGVIDVRALGTPPPTETWFVEAGISYGGVNGTGQAYVYLADGHTAVTKPVIVLEGFDLDNSMGWDELYALLNREGLLETLRSRGFDAVVLNFSEATDYMQRNAFVAVELIETVRDTAPPGTRIPLIGASMGGLIGRYALAYMETNGRPHPISSFISFDSPQAGAGIPLGIQYWLSFFADDSAEAAALLAALDAPAARQLLAYHHTDPPSGGGVADPLRTQFLTDLAALGSYPSAPRKVAIANGSGNQVNQGFAPGAQVIRWEYTSFLVDITGNVWALPNSSSHVIFDGLIDFIFLPEDAQTVVVSGTRPFDNCPGGWRASMAQMDATPAPYGDIVALFPNHAFIPTVSALHLNQSDLFYDIAGDPNLLAITPFDAVYYPTENQEHVLITPENAAWFLAEIEAAATGVEEGPVTPPTRGVAQVELFPNPASSDSELRYVIPQAGPATLSLFDAAGRRVRVLLAGELPAGEARLSWSAGGPDRLPSGVYWMNLAGRNYAASRRVVLP